MLQRFLFKLAPTSEGFGAAYVNLNLQKEEGKVERRAPGHRWTFKRWVSRTGEVLVAIADSILGNFRR